MWKSDAYQSPETYYSLFLIIFYGLIFCLIDFLCSSLSSRLRHHPLRFPTAQWHRQFRQLVNPDKEAGRTSDFDIYTAVFTTRVYNLCPFTPFSLARLLARSQIGRRLFTCRLWQKEVTGVNHSNLAFVYSCVCVCMWGCLRVEVLRRHAHALRSPDQTFYWTPHCPVCASKCLRTRKHRHGDPDRNCEGDLHMCRVMG